MAQARKKASKAVSKPSRLTHHLKESAFLLSILIAVYLFACLFTYHPTDPGPFSTTNSDIVQNAGRILGAWIADAFLGLTGYISYLLPVITIYGGWRVWTKKSLDSETGLMEAVAIITGLILFLLSSTGLSDMHLLPAAGSMPANGGGVIGAVVASPLLQWTGMLGSTLFLFSMMLVGITLFTGLSWFYVMDVTGRITLSLGEGLMTGITNMRDWFAGRRARAKRDVVRKSDTARQVGKRHRGSNRKSACRRNNPVNGWRAKNKDLCSITCRPIPYRHWVSSMSRMINSPDTVKTRSRPSPNRLS